MNNIINLRDWFIGIMEGEGNFCKHRIAPRVRIGNTDLDILSKCKKFLHANCILFREYERKLINKKFYTLQIHGQDARNLYTLLGHKVECRNDQFSSIINKQVQLNGLSISLSWLVGIIEAEGSFLINYNNYKNFSIGIHIGNTNLKIIDKIKFNLDHLNCSFVNVISYLKYYKNCLSIRINRREEIKKFLEQTKGLWQSSRNIKRSNLLLEFIDSRSFAARGNGYSKREIEIYQQMRELNK